MAAKSQNERIFFGLMVKQLRLEKGLSFADLAQSTGVSVSYLNEIEKGKKYPKEEKLLALAEALGVAVETLASTELNKSLAPVADLLQSNFLNELPLDLFGIELYKVVEIIANAPVRVGAFISTLLELSRTYSLREENFYFGALRSYLELNNNYFEDLEAAVDQFVEAHQLEEKRPLNVGALKDILQQNFGYTIIENGLDRYEELQKLRSLFIPKKKHLLLNGGLSPMQKAFQLGKELGFNVLKIKERANTSSLLQSRVFEEVLNHSKAIYFSVALHIPRDPFIRDLQTFFEREQWEEQAFIGIMRKYEASPEMFYHRLTNVLPRFFDMNELFFLRFSHDPEKRNFEIDKELHLTRKHHPHGNGIFEHYCRRWVSLSSLNELDQLQKQGKFAQYLVRVQRSKFIGTDDEYLCLTIARPGYPTPNRNVSVTLGLLADQKLKEKIHFFEDPAILIKEVNKTCERCDVKYCQERAAPPVVVNKREEWRKVQDRLGELLG
ncbi:MAG TPA: helix-turn-helix domain-containing protein [Saprospiraceae bacterium]|nr:helix-turn-helix domain-containing protein [Saprospiraceae bacterium]HMQ82256.1 helix-turn-helix domain-containing protein [Saprospiraceae bacterium]